ncbi:unnamed protein product [Anisakis simplex]|uniref:MFS domain-containing protein n=1 Tax=Anisakis simplex TaxID=6269 RepID=A0A158PNL6_ANISI|nr:unnamed protein product [Anisakis simplex]
MVCITNHGYEQALVILATFFSQKGHVRHQNVSVSSEQIRIAQQNETLNSNLSSETVELINNLLDDNVDDPGLAIDEIIWLTPHDKSLLISAVAIGALLAHFPIVWLIDHYGIRMIFGPLGILSAMATLLIPMAARIGLIPFIGVRLLQGIAFATYFSVTGSFITKWTSIEQSGLFISVLVACLQLSPVITMPIGGFVCTYYSWPYIYFGHGAVSLILFAFFIPIYRNSPSKHPLVNCAELKRITAGKEQVTKKEMRTIPYIAILTTASVWAIWISAFALMFCDNIIFFFAPTYLHAVLGFQINDTGLTAAIPTLLQVLMKIGCGSASDKMRCMGDACKVKLFNSLAFIGCAICLIVLGMFGEDQKLISLILLSASTAFLGLTVGGCLKSAPLVAHHYAAFVTGNVSLAMSLTMLIVPFLVAFLAPDNTPLQWRYVCDSSHPSDTCLHHPFSIFFSAAALLILTNVIFVTFGSAKTAVWAIPNASSHIQMSMNVKVIRVNDDAAVSSHHSIEQ